MRRGIEYTIFIVILFIGAGITVLFIIERPQPPLPATFAPAFQLLGRTPKAFDRVLSRTVPVSDLDEKRYAEAIILRYKDEKENKSIDYQYLNDLMKEISRFAKKPFNYRIFVMHNPKPNAFALPGGVIFITDGLLAIMKSEAELIYIIAHEMGHIERSHCFDAVRYELAARKIGSGSLGMLADFTVRLMLRHSFSKTQEDEADEYAYELILNTEYDPSSPGHALKRLMEYKKQSPASGREKQTSVIRDYFMSHPPIVLRYEKFFGMAKQWWKEHPEERRYCGEENLRQRTCFDKTNFDKEWVTGEKGGS
ncbi:MAG: Metalloprotease LoiP precursor [Syntrophorhabdus sp. PtaU1.Bin058]|nr:MAG: Metalloprotease LoiP precursor [Syntrophorhabdus sp. PtaU1.Bin058]